MIKKIVMIDQDEVVSEGGFLYLINKFLGTNYVKEDFTDFYMQNVIPEELRNEFFHEFILNYNIYDYSYLMSNAKEVIEKLESSKEYEPFIVTDPLIPEIKYECGMNIYNKFKFLVVNSLLEPYHYAFMGNKKVFAAHIRIDDKVPNLVDALYPPEMKLLYPSYHNRELSQEYLDSLGIERADWPSIERKLLH